jgi:hypothetical protein
MRKSLLLLALGLLVGSVALWTAPVLADQGNTVMGDEHFGDIDIGEDYTTTLPYGIGRNPGGYFANDAWDGQGSFANSNTFQNADPTTDVASQIIPFLLGDRSGGSQWFYPCPIDLTGLANLDAGGNMVNSVKSTNFPCAGLVAGEFEDPQTNDVGLAVGADNASDVTFKQGLYNTVHQNWVDNNVPLHAGAEDPIYAGSTWSGTLDQDLATLFEYASGADAGGGDTGMDNGAPTFLGIDQTLDQGLAYLEGTHTSPFPGGILDTSIRGMLGDAQRIVQTFELTDTQARNATGDQVDSSGNPSEGAVDVVHQWVADWMRSTATNAVGGGNADTALGSNVTWTLETLLSSSVKQEGDNTGETYIHQVNDQYSMYTADWTSGNSVANNPLNAQADVGQGNMVVGHSLSMEFWHAQTNTIDYDRTVQGFTSAPENVIGGFGTHDGDHNPLNN